MDRKEFLRKISGIVLIGIPAYSVISCSGSNDDPTLNTNNPPGGNSNKNCLANGTKSSIGSNHGHSMLVSKDDVSNGVSKQYAIKGSSSHDHKVTITVDNFKQLKNNLQIQVSSTTDDGHSHSVTVSCA